MADDPQTDSYSDAHEPPTHSCRERDSRAHYMHQQISADLELHEKHAEVLCACCMLPDEQTSWHVQTVAVTVLVASH